MRTVVSSPRFLAVVLALLLLPSAAARADLIFFKDGFVQEGKTIRDGRAIVDNGESVWMPVGFFYVDDFVRRAYFSPLQIQEPIRKPMDFGIEYRWPRQLYPPGVRTFGAVADTLEVGPWDDRGQRRMTIRAPKGDTRIIQQVTILNPHYVRADTKSNSNHKWVAYYRPQEIGAETVRRLLAGHPDLKITTTLKEEEIATRRFRIFQFLVSAGWYDEAEQELKSIESDLPNLKDKIATNRATLKKLKSQQLFDDIHRAQGAGQHELVLKRLAEFPEEGVEEQLQTEVRDLKRSYDTARTNLELARRYLKSLPLELTAPIERGFFTEVAVNIAEEIGLEDFLPSLGDLDRYKSNRLDAFLLLAKQAEMRRKAGRVPQCTPSELLSLAVTGWALGNGSAEKKFDVAQRLWQARKLVLTYEKTPNQGMRLGLLATYQKSGANAVPVDEMAHLLGFLPPPEPDTKVDPLPVERQVGARRGGPTYLLKLPPEYRHARAAGYPVLIALHQGGAKPKDVVDRLGDLAAQNGYILIAPEWEQGFRPVYNYTAEEHDVVLESLRDLRRHYHVDSDRVFLFGHGEGGSMSYDVGLSHPDLFAGVLPMTARPQYFTNRYWANAQYLPFYVIGGDYCGDSCTETREFLFEQWVPRGFPAMYILYRGRGMDFFGAELPIAFDWMSRKTRANPTQEVGRTGGGLNVEFQTMRQTDNHFYWLSTDSVRNANLNDAAKWRPGIYAATLQARISEGNQINVNVYGVNQVTVWLGRGSTIDFDKPLTVYINLTRYTQKVQPNLATLLEDLYERGDRQRPYFARMDFKVGR